MDADDGWSDMLSVVALLNFLTIDWATDLDYAGMVDPDLGGGGIAYRPGNESWSNMNSAQWTNSPQYVRGGGTMSHELGHNKGLRHVDCRGDEEDGGSVDSGYPYPFPDCSLHEVDEEGY